MPRSFRTSAAAWSSLIGVVLAGAVSTTAAAALKPEAVASTTTRAPRPKASTTVTTLAPTTTTTAPAPAATSPAPAPAPAPTTTTTIAPPASPAFSTRISAGGSNPYAAPDGRTWSADRSYVGGAPAAATASAISGTDRDTLYQKHRWAVTSYDVAVPCPATYRVDLHFAETYWYAAGQRIFSVTAEWATKLADVDVVAAVGKEAALVRSFDVAVADGTLDLGFVRKVDQTMVAGIEVTQVGACGSIAAAPTAAPATYDVPASIVADCSRAVDAEIRAWLATVPDNAVARFAANGCYGQSGTIVLTDRTALTVDGNGSTFRALTVGDIGRRNWRLQGGSRITLKNMTVRGANPRAGIFEGSYDGAYEYQHGFSIEGTQGATLDNVKAFDVYGDFVTVHHDERYNPYTTDPARQITVRNAHFERSGRQGVSPTNVEGFLLERSYLGAVNMNAVDVELDFNEARGKDIRIIGNTFGSIRFSVLANVGAGVDPNVGPITLDGNTMVGPLVSCRPPVHAETYGGLYRSGYVITNNRFMALGNAFDFIGAKAVTVTGNTVTFIDGGCGTRAAVGLVDSHGVSVTGNTFTGALQAVKPDARSTGVTTSANTL